MLSNHDLQTKIDLKRTTQEDCAKACAMRDKTFSYFGLQNGTSCYCGKDHGKYGKLSDDKCNITCDGNDAETCGGHEANNVFFYGLGNQSCLPSVDESNYSASNLTSASFQ